MRKRSLSLADRQPLVASTSQLAQNLARMAKIHKTRGGEFTELWGYPERAAYGSHKLGQIGPAHEGDGFEASREMKSGLEIQTFRTQKAAEDWIIQADVWGPLK